MDLYFAPLSCSLATRIALYQSGQAANFHQVMLATKRTAAGDDYLAITPQRQVPALRTAEGRFLTEGAAILQYVADQAPASGLAPAAGSFERYELQQWLNYIGSELHKQVFYAIFSPTPPEAKAHARDVVLPGKYDYLSRHLQDREFLLGKSFTVADAYLVTTLNWAAPAGVDLGKWPVLAAYRERLCSRPAVGRAIGEEMALRSAA